MEYDDHMAYKRLEALNAHTNVLQATLATLRQDSEDSEATDLANMPLDTLTADDASLPSHLRASARVEARCLAQEGGEGAAHVQPS